MASDTPRTEALMARHARETIDGYNAGTLRHDHALKQAKELIEFAQQLEREVADVVRKAAAEAIARGEIHVSGVPEELTPKHPWQAFLEARSAAIDWMHDDGKTDAMIAATLSMDSATQVYLIRTRDRSLDMNNGGAK